MESLTNEETKLVSQFRMTYNEATEALANTADRYPSDCKPWRKDVVTAQVGRVEKSALASRDEDASNTRNKIEDDSSFNESCSSGDGMLAIHLQGPESDDVKADATETTMESTDYSESTDHGVAVFGIQCEESAQSETQPARQTTDMATILAEATDVIETKDETTATILSKRKIATHSKVQEFAPVPVAPMDFFQSAAPSLSNILMREYDLTYAKARSVIIEARTKLGDKVDQRALERHCRSLILFKGKEDFRNVVLRSIDRRNGEFGKQSRRQAMWQDPQFVGSSAVETMIMNQYKILYSSAKSLADEARAELKMKPWDNMTEEFKQTCDRLYTEKFTVKSRLAWSTGTIADAKSLFESSGNRPFDQKDQVFRRRTQPTMASVKKLGRSVTPEFCGESSSSLLNRSLTSLECLDAIEESAEISHGTCIDDESTKAAAIHVDYENEDINDCSTSSESIVYLGDIVESAVICQQEKPCDPIAVPKMQGTNQLKSHASHVEHKLDKRQPDDKENGLLSCVRAKSPQKTIEKEARKSRDGEASTPSAGPGDAIVKSITKAGPPGKKITKTRKKKTSQAPRSASSSSTRKASGPCGKSDQLTAKITSDRKASTPVNTVDSSVNSEEHSQKTVRVKNTKKSHNKTKLSTSQQNTSKQTLPATEEVSEHSRSAHEETIALKETRPQKSTLKHRPPSNGPKKKREPTKKQAPNATLAGENKILEAILMSQFGMNPAVASKVASEARKNTNFPEWKKWNALLLAECEKQLETLNEKIDKRNLDISIEKAGDPNQPDTQAKQNNKDDIGVNATSVVAAAQQKSKDIDITEAKQTPEMEARKEVSKLDTSCIIDKEIMEADVEDLMERKSKFDPISSMYLPKMMCPQQYPQLMGAEAMARPLETILTRRHGISWNTASHMVKRGRRALDMTESEAWTPQLEEYCEQEIMDGASSVGETAMSYSLADTRSIVVSVAAASYRMDCDTEVGKDWTEHTLEECSQVSRCPSQTNDFVIVEDGSYASEDSFVEETPPVGFNPEASNDPTMKAEIVPNPLGVPQVIYLFHGQFPEVPGDEPLEARVGMPFIRSGTRRSKKKSFLDRMRSSLRRFRRKAIGYRPRRLQEDDTECRMQTLMSL